MRTIWTVAFGSAVVVQACRTPAAPPPGALGPIPGPTVPAAMPDLPARPPPELKPFQMASMLGPYQRLDEICRQPSPNKPEHSRCGPEVPASTLLFEGKTALDAPSDPYLEARLVARNEYHEPQAAGAGLTLYHFGIRTREGWFFLAEFAQTYEPAFASHHEWLVVAPMRLVPTGEGKAPLLELSYWAKLSDDNLGSDETIAGASQQIIVCGLSSGGQPRCTAPTVIASNDSLTRVSTGVVVSQTEWQLVVRYGARTVELSVPAGASAANVPASLLGTHPLDFAPATP